MKTWTTLLPLALLLPAATFAQGRSTRMHDVRALETVARASWPLIDVRLPLRTSFLDNLEPDGWDIDAGFRLSLAEAGWPRVFEALARGDEAEDLVVRGERAGFLQIEADAAGHAFVERSLASLEARLLRPVQLELYRLDGGDGVADTRAILTAADVERLVGAGGAHRAAVTPATIGNPARLGEVGRRSVLYEYDVEVAEDAGTGDPQVTSVPEGPEFGALVLERPGGGLHLRVWGRATVRGESRTLSGKSASVDLPRCASELVAGSALLEPGGGVVLGGRGPGAHAWLVRVVGPAPDVSRLPYVPVGRLLSTPLFFPPVWIEPAPVSGGWVPDDEEFFEVDSAYSDSELVDLLFSADGAGGVDRDPWTFAAGGVLVNGSDELVARTRAWLDEGESALGGTVAIDVRVGAVPAREASSTDLAALAERLPARWQGAAVEGDTLLVAAGEEAMMLVDHDVEIASGAVAVDPIVTSIFSGTTLWCRPSATRDGGVQLEYDLRVVEHGPLETVRVDFGGFYLTEDEGATSGNPEQRTNFALTETVELAEQRRVGTRGQLALRAGEWALALQQEMNPGSGEVVVALVRATRVH